MKNQGKIFHHKMGGDCRKIKKRDMNMHSSKNTHKYELPGNFLHVTIITLNVFIHNK